MQIQVKLIHEKEDNLFNRFIFIGYYYLGRNIFWIETQRKFI